jgi:hypothetical protein
VDSQSGDLGDGDRTITEIAAAYGGRYNIDIHLRHDPNAAETFPRTHVPALAIRRATGGVERQPDGTWIIAPDHLDRVTDYQRRLARARRVGIEFLSTLSIERQVGADGATCLDCQIVREVSQNLPATASAATCAERCTSAGNG